MDNLKRFQNDRRKGIFPRGHCIEVCPSVEDIRLVFVACEVELRQQTGVADSLQHGPFQIEVQVTDPDECDVRARRAYFDACLNEEIEAFPSVPVADADDNLRLGSDADAIPQALACHIPSRWAADGVALIQALGTNDDFLVA